MHTITDTLKTTVTKTIELPYLLYLPETPDACPQPLLLFLHGSGQRGADLELLKEHGPPRVIEDGTSLPFVVAAPQCPADAWWQVEPLEVLLCSPLENYAIDETRVYLTGLSMGGYVRFTVYPDAAHDSWSQAYRDPDLYDWFLQHRLT